VTVERVPLSRERVADAALQLIDEHGLDSLTMRKLGAALDVEAMSLYNHVDSKDDLLIAVVDLLYRKVLEAFGAPDGDWREWARAMSRAYVRVADAHPNAAMLMVERTDHAGAGLEFLQHVVDQFDRPDVGDRVGMLAFTTVSRWVVGTIVQEHGAFARYQQIEDLDPSAPPSVARMRRAALDDLTPEARFEWGLEAVLDGIEAQVHKA